MNMLNVKDAVKLGVKWLDQNYPNWFTKIDLVLFNYSNTQKCVIGQLKLWDVVYKLNLNREYENWSLNHGFDLTGYDWDNDVQGESVCKKLHKEWLEQINNKLSQKASEEAVIIKVSHKELLERFPEKLKEMLEILVLDLNKDQAKEWGIGSYEFEARVK